MVKHLGSNAPRGPVSSDRGGMSPPRRSCWYYQWACQVVRHRGALYLFNLEKQSWRVQRGSSHCYGVSFLFALSTLSSDSYQQLNIMSTYNTHYETYINCVSIGEVVNNFLDVPDEARETFNQSLFLDGLKGICFHHFNHLASNNHWLLFYHRFPQSYPIFGSGMPYPEWTTLGGCRECV